MNPELVRVAARVFVFATLGVALFQLALVAGAPWGHLTLGGQYEGALPGRGRAIAAFSCALLITFAWIITRRASLKSPDDAPRIKRAAWLVVLYSGVGIVANAATPSAAERALWLPVVIVMFATSLVVARSRGES